MIVIVMWLVVARTTGRADQDGGRVSERGCMEPVQSASSLGCYGTVLRERQSCMLTPTQCRMCPVGCRPDCTHTCKLPLCQKVQCSALMQRPVELCAEEALLVLLLLLLILLGGEGSSRRHVWTSQLVPLLVSCFNLCLWRSSAILILNSTIFRRKKKPGVNIRQTCTYSCKYQDNTP